MLEVNGTQVHKVNCNPALNTASDANMRVAVLPVTHSRVLLLPQLLQCLLRGGVLGEIFLGASARGILLSINFFGKLSVNAMIFDIATERLRLHITVQVGECAGPLNVSAQLSRASCPRAWRSTTNVRD